MIREILPDRLFIGNSLDARDLRLLYRERIAAVVDLAANEPPALLGRDMIYFRTPLFDGEGNDAALVETALRCVVMLIESEFRTVVACSAGMSRSPAIAAAAIAIVTERPPDDCLLEITTNAPHDVSPVLWSCVKIAYKQLLAEGG